MPVGAGGSDAGRRGDAAERARGVPPRRAGHGLAQRVQPSPRGHVGAGKVHYSPAGVSRWAVTAPGRRVAARPITELQLREDTGPAGVRRAAASDPSPSRGGGCATTAPRWSSAPWWWCGPGSSRGCPCSATAASRRGGSTSGTWSRRVWSTTQGRFLDTTDVSGMQFTRLGAHVDRCWRSSRPCGWAGRAPRCCWCPGRDRLAGALPAFWLGRRWLGDDRLAVAGGGGLPADPALQTRRSSTSTRSPSRRRCCCSASGPRRRRRWVDPRGLRDPGGAVPGAGGTAGRRPCGLAVVPHPEPARAAVVLGAGGAGVGGHRVGGHHAGVRPRGLNPHLSRYSLLGDAPATSLAS